MRLMQSTELSQMRDVILGKDMQALTEGVDPNKTATEDVELDEAKKRYVKYEIEKTDLPGRGPWMAKVYRKDGTWETTFGRTKKAVEKDVKALMGFDEDVEITEGKRYYVLAGKASKTSPWEVVFGDYDKENVRDEKDSESGSWKKLKIISLGTDKQSAIDAAIKKLREDVELDEGKQKPCHCKSIQGWKAEAGGFGQGTWVTCEKCGGHAMNRLNEIGATAHYALPVLKSALAKAKKLREDVELDEGKPLGHEHIGMSRPQLVNLLKQIPWIDKLGPKMLASLITFGQSDGLVMMLIRSENEAEYKERLNTLRSVRGSMTANKANTIISKLKTGKYLEDVDKKETGMGTSSLIREMRNELLGGQAGDNIELDDKSEGCDTPGKKTKSKGKGKGLARGRGKGPLGIPVGEKADEDVELDEAGVYNILGHSKSSNPSGEAQKLAKRIKTEIEKSMPPGYVLVCEVRSSLGRKHIYLVTALEKDKSKWSNGIMMNDPALHKIIIYGVNEDDTLADKLEANIATGGKLMVKPDPGSHYAFGSVKFGWRKKKGTPDQIVKHFGNYFKKVKKVIQDNKGRLPKVFKSTEDIEMHEGGIERPVFPKKFKIKGTGSAKDIVVTGTVGRQMFKTVTYDVKVDSLKTKEQLATGKVIYDTVHDVVAFNMKSDNAPSGAEKVVKGMIKKELLAYAKAHAYEDVELDEIKLSDNEREILGLGKAAFLSGKKRIPARDKTLMGMIKGMKPGAGAKALLSVWLRGWDQANLAKREESVELDEGKLTSSQVVELRKETVKNGIPVRFLVGGRAIDIMTGELSKKGSNVMHHPVYWNFTKETAKKVAKMVGAKAVFSEDIEDVELEESISPVSDKELKTGLESGKYEYVGTSDGLDGKVYYRVRDHRRNGEMQYIAGTKYKKSKYKWIEKYEKHEDVELKEVNVIKKLRDSLLGDSYDAEMEESDGSRFRQREYLTEAPADIILQQLGGGNRLRMMIGAKHIYSDDNGKSLVFQFPNRLRSKPNYVKITLTSMDLYDVQFGRVGKKGFKKLKRYTMVYADMLKDMFEKETGLYIRL